MEGLGLSLWLSYCLAHSIQKVFATSLMGCERLENIRACTPRVSTQPSTTLC